jgi:hypothetical protein
MTKKQFEAIAKILNRYTLADPAPGTFDEGYADASFGIAVELADYFETTNPLFDRERFLLACGIKVRGWER